MIVIDASSLAKYILREKNWEEVRAYLLNEVYSLTLALSEVSNAIWKHHVIYNEISCEDAKTMLRALKRLKDVIIFEQFENYLEEALDISIRGRITVYDSLYIAQAKRAGCLLTSDDKQRNVAKEVGIDVIFVE